MPVTQAFLDSYNQTNISLYRQLNQADKDSADLFFGNQCDSPSPAYTGVMDKLDAGERTVLNKYALWD